MKTYLTLIAIFLVTSTAVAAQEDRLAIIGTMQECQQANIFYNKCMQKDDQTHDIFLKNLAIITEKSLQAVKDTNPNMSDAEVSQLYLDRKDILEQMVSRGIDKRGCEAENYQKRYKICVEWRP